MLEADHFEREAEALQKHGREDTILGDMNKRSESGAA
jgi:hypothetical protein